MARLGISDKSFFAFNPLPDVTDAEVLERAGLTDLVQESRVRPFHIAWNYGFGPDGEVVRLKPGDKVVLRKSEADMFAHQYADEGMVLLEDASDPEHVRQKSIEGVERAIRFYNLRGRRRLVEIRKNLQYSKEDMEDSKADHWVYYANEAKADILRDYLKQLRKPVRKPKE